MKFLHLLLFTLFTNLLFSQTDSTKGFKQLSDSLVLVNNISNTFAKQGWYVRDSITKEKFFVDTNSVFIKFSNLPARDSILRIGSRHQLIFKRITLSNWVNFVVPDTVNYFQCLKKLDKINGAIMDQGFQNKLHGSITPNDPNFSSQWGLQKINMEEAWDINTGDPSVTVAVIDAGIDWSDELGDGTDGYNNWFFNLQEDAWSTPSSGGNGLDDDNNNKIDDWRGWNFASNNEFPGGTSEHGDQVASIIAGKTNNNNLISGIAGGWNSGGVKLLALSVKNNPSPQGFPTTLVVDAIDYAVEMNVDIINYSSGGPGISQAMKDAVNNATKNHDIVFVASSGNANSLGVHAPARMGNVIGVGATDNTDSRGVWSGGGSNYGSALALAAPGDGITTIANNSLRTGLSGTSFAAPMVSGVAALMISENNCLSRLQIKNILTQTAEQVGGYSYNSIGKSNELGHGRLNAEDALKVAQSMKSATVDLYMKDNDDDFGQEPSPGIYTDQGPDIWYRNNSDGLNNRKSEPLTFDGSNFYVYVRVRNKSCVASSQGILKLYWTKLGTAQSWPSNWTTPPTGDFIGALNIPTIEPGESQIFEFPWDMSSILNQNPGLTAEACLLARITGVQNDPIISHNVLYNEVKNNNNLTAKNLVIRRASFFVDNGTVKSNLNGNGIDGVEIPYNIAFTPTETYSGNALVEEADVFIHLGEALWDRWLSSGQNSTNIEIYDLENKILRLDGINSSINNVYMEGVEQFDVGLSVEFISSDLSEKNEFNLIMEQRYAQGDSLAGSVHYSIHKEFLEDLEADAGEDEELFYHQLHSFTANNASTNPSDSISYKWYNSNDSLLSSGKTLSIVARNNEQYVLRVESKLFSLVDYDTVGTSVKSTWIKSLHPNPSGNYLDVQFTLPRSVTNAQLVITNVQTNRKVKSIPLSFKSIKKVNLSQRVDLTGLANANYILTLKANGRQVDSSPFIKH